MQSTFRPARRTRRLAVVLALAALVAAPVWAAGKRARDMPIPRPELEGSERLAKDKPAEAEQFFLKKRLAPGMTRLPVERLLQGREHARKLPLHSASADRLLEMPLDAEAVSALSWTALGPGNIGGRTRALQFAPNDANTIYVGGVAGGVWKTTNFGTSWTPLGDFMANMAVNSLAIDPINPLVIYAGTGEGYFNFDSVRGAGIFKSIDGGVNWTQLASTAPPGTTNFTRVNALVISPNNNAVLYAATRNGLFRSTDSGATWTQQINASAALGCTSVVVRGDVAVDDNVVVSCGTFSPTATATGIWRSTNGNAVSPTWTHVLGPSGSGATATLANMGRTSLAIAKSSQATMYALIACSASGANQCGTGNVFDDGLLAVYGSTDGGATWSARYNNSFSGSTIANALLTNTYFQICNNFSGLNQGWYDNVIAVDPTEPLRVFVGGIDQWRSDDGGASWGTISYWWLGEGFFPYAHADQHGIFFHPDYDGDTEKRTLITNDGGLFVASDAATATPATAKINICPVTTGHLRGATWTSLNNGYGVTQYYHGTAYPGGATYFGGTQDNGTSRGSDAGGSNAWTEILGGDGGWTAIDKNTSGGTTVLYAENTGISISKSTDNGASFLDAVSGITNTGCGQFINPFQMDPNNTQRLFTSHSALWRTSNAAGTWTQASADIPGASCSGGADSGERFSNYAVAFGNSNLLVAGTDNGRVCRLTSATTSTSGTALQNCSFPAGSGSYVSAIAFDPQNSAFVYASVSTFGVGHVWRSIDSGVSWTNIDGSGVNGLPDVPATSVAVSPFDSMTIYVGTDIGVFVTTDGGTSWARENTGFANVITDHLVFSPVDSSNAQLFAFTHGRGVFRTTVSTNLTAANLSITKTDGIATVNAGGNLTYTITVTNPVNAALTSVAVADAFPAGLTCTWTCAASAGGSCAASGSGSIMQGVNIGPNGTVTFTAPCTVSAGASGNLVNTAVVTYAGDPTPANNTATDTDTVVPQANLGITKSDGSGTANAGGSVSYTIVVTNPATSTVSNVGVSDTFPVELSGCTWTCAASAGGSCQSANGSNNIATTTNSIAGNNGTLTFGATCTLSAAATGSLANTATVSYANDPTPGNNSATDTDTILAQANIGITKTDGIVSIDAGSPTTYTIVVTNPSTGAVTNVGVSDTFPGTLSGCNWTCVASAGGACQSAGAAGNIATSTNSIAASGGTLTFSATCTLSASASGSLANTATTSYANDPTPGNNSALDTDTIVPQANLGITKTDGATSISAGAQVTYTIVASNPSGNAVGNVTVADTFPGTLSACTWTCTPSGGSACTANGSGNINNSGVTIAAGGNVSYSATCTLSAGASGTLANTATVSYANDPTPGNDSAIDNDTIVPQADLAISKTDGVGSVNAGAQVSYTIVASNPSGNAVSGVTVADTFPGTLSGCTWTCTPSAGSVCTANGSGNINNSGVTIAAGGNVSYGATCTLSASASGNLANTASVTYGGDTNGSNNSAIDTDTIVPQANLGITKTDGVGTINAGATVGYSIVVTNPSTNTVANVGVSDTFPGTLSGCSWTCAASGAGACQSANGSGNIATTTNSVAGSNGTLTFTVSACTLSTGAGGTLANTASVSYANDPTPGNNSAIDSDTIVPQADLGITKTDGATTVNAGASVAYTIVVTNPSANTVGNVAVSDSFPGTLSGCTWTCAASAGGSCQSANGSNGIDTTTNAVAASGGTLTFNATCTLSASATGSLANTAFVSYSNDPGAGNNTATDTDTIVPPPANVGISKSDGQASVNAGSGVSYTIVVTNPAPSAIFGVGVGDTFPAALSGCTWTCAASSGGACAPTGSGNIAESVSLAASGGSATFVATCQLAASATGQLQNTATATYANDPTPGNNSATDTDTIVPQADLSIAKTDDAASALLGAPVAYAIVVTNPSAATVANVTVTDNMPAVLGSCSWTCVAGPNGSCAANGNGNIAQVVTVGANESVTFTATCTLSESASGTLANTATVAYSNDPNAPNNSATDTDAIVSAHLFEDGFEDPPPP